MKAIPNGCKRNDVVMTPESLCKEIVDYFKPNGRILEPCKGTGNFLKFLPNSDWCEISEGKDFFDCDDKFDWIVTNPPYSIMRKFLQHSMKLSDNIVFLAPLNHFMLTARLRDIRESGFAIKEMLLIDYPDNFPKMGFALGVIHLQKGYVGDVKFDNQKHFTTHFHGLSSKGENNG